MMPGRRSRRRSGEVAAIPQAGPSAAAPGDHQAETDIDAVSPLSRRSGWLPFAGALHPNWRHHAGSGPHRGAECRVRSGRRRTGPSARCADAWRRRGNRKSARDPRSWNLHAMRCAATKPQASCAPYLGGAHPRQRDSGCRPGAQDRHLTSGGRRLARRGRGDPAAASRLAGKRTVAAARPGRVAWRQAASNRTEPLHARQTGSP
jgi:hypothetical protein